MGKASRRKHAEEQQRLYFDIKGDVRSHADRTKARAMLDALQKKLVDDALREDGFYFLDGKYVEARRPRYTPGMKSQTFDGHTRRITRVALVAMDEPDPASSPDLNSFVVTFATDSVSVWNMKTGEHLGSLDVLSRCAVTICGAATRPQRGNLLWIGFATHLEPTVVVFDTNTSTFLSQVEQDQKWDFTVGHQQQIMCMSFSHNPDEALLATGSLDSTCIIWKNAPDSPRPTLRMLLILPVTEAGVSGCTFTCDDEELVTLGFDGTLKLWRVGADVNTHNLHIEREEWHTAVPFTFTVPHTRDILLFGDALPSFHGNDEWLVHHKRSCFDKQESLGAPGPIKAMEDNIVVLTRTGTNAQQDDGTEAQVISTAKIEELLTTPDDQAGHQRAITDNLVVEETREEAATSLKSTKDTNQEIEEAIDAVERLRREYEKLDSFDFERMLNPSTPVLFPSGTGETSVEQIKWPRVTPDADGRLLVTFIGRKPNGDFAAHTSHVTDCAVAREVDLVTTVSFDKSVVCWSLSQGNVRSIRREAHAAPITSCALTSPTTSQPTDLPLLLATAAKDNLVKVWRFHSLEACDLEIVYTLCGHYDAITTLCFDASGVFLLSASDDTLAHCWRVRPAPPDAPQKPIVLNVDRFAITIEWRVPLANGAALTKYVVHTEQLSSLSLDGSDMKIIKDHAVEVKYKTLTVDNLQPGIQYRLCVAAVNSVGQSLWSETTDAVETLAFAPSKIDKSVAYRDVTATSVRLTWNAPCANGAVITSYTIKALPENSMFVPAVDTPVPVKKLSIVVPQPDVSRRRHPTKLKLKKPEAKKKQAATGPVQHEYVLEGLWPGEVYQFIVAAENRCGLGEFSPFSDYIKMESTAPDAPAKPEISNVEKRHAEVTWIKPRSNGSEILQYIIEWTQDSHIGDENPTAAPMRSSVTLLTKSIVGTTYRITGLRPGRPLCVWVAATNLVNGKLTASPFSERSDTVYTLPDVPDQPDRPRIESPTAHSIVIAIDPPCDNGARIERYEIALFAEEIQFGIVTKTLVREMELLPSEFDLSSGDTVSDHGPLRITMVKLRAKTFYSATVVTTNALGRSKRSENSVAVATKPPTVPAAIPTAPDVRDIAPTQATLAWARPAHDGGAALASIVLQYSINDGAFEHEIVVFEGSELVLEHLKPRTQYVFRVAATNGVGRAAFSPPSPSFTTPSLVEFTIATYFASRPPLEHAKAAVLQRRFRLWKQRERDRRVFLEQLTSVLKSSWHVL